MVVVGRGGGGGGGGGGGVCGVAVEEAEGVVGDRVPHAVRRSGPTCGRASWLRGLGLGLGLKDRIFARYHCTMLTLYRVVSTPHLALMSQAISIR